MTPRPSRWRSAGSFLVEATKDFFRDDAMMLAGALAFYTALSLAPLTVLLLWIASLLGPSAQDELVAQIVDLVGDDAGQAVRTVVENAESEPGRGLAGIVGAVTLVVSATGVFAQLQTALNRIWDVRPKPGAGLWTWLRKRLLSLGMVVTIGFLLVVSLALNAVISLLWSKASAVLPGAEQLWIAVNFLTSLALFVALFAAVFKVLPDARISWRDVGMGATLTAVLFSVGKLLIGLYLGHKAVGSSYGAAGSLLIFLIWVYYSAVIVFFGAELTQVWASRYGKSIVPDSHAIREGRKELAADRAGRP